MVFPASLPPDDFPQTIDPPDPSLRPHPAVGRKLFYPHESNVTGLATLLSLGSVPGRRCIMSTGILRPEECATQFTANTTVASSRFIAKRSFPGQPSIRFLSKFPHFLKVGGHRLSSGRRRLLRRAFFHQIHKRALGRSACQIGWCRESCYVQ